MKVGEIFQRDGAFWMADQVTPDQNKFFNWIKVIAKWSGFGPMPTQASVDRVFYMDRRHKSSGAFVIQ